MTNNDTNSPEHPESGKARSYWNERWQRGETGWDIGSAAPAIVRFMETYPDKDAAILIPGCGNAYEAEALAANGFRNITLLDIAPKAVAQLREKFAHLSQIQVLEGDFFRHEGCYDLILEQTFFCAIPPERRPEYVRKTASLLRDGGRLAGVLFHKIFEKQGPPFGGQEAEYRTLFSPYFHISKMEPCSNSIPPRAGSELFINLVKKQGN